MMRILKIACLVVVGPWLAACQSAYTSERAYVDTGSSIQTAVTGGGLQGTEETLVSVVDSTTNRESLMVRSGYGLGREVIRETIPAVANTLTGGFVANALQKPGCDGNDCNQGGPTFNIQGGQGGQALAVTDVESNAGAELNVSGAACPRPINGQCPAAP